MSKEVDIVGENGRHTEGGIDFDLVVMTPIEFEYGARVSEEFLTATASEAEILATKTGYAKGVKLTGTMPNVGGQNITISDKSDSKSISTGFHDGSGTVSIEPLEKEKLVGSNIRNGVVLLGVKGTMTGTESVQTESKTVTSSFSPQTVILTPDKYLSQVVINPVPVQETPNSAGGITVTIG